MPNDDDVDRIRPQGAAPRRGSGESGGSGSGRADDGGDRGRRADEPNEIPASGWKDIALRVKDEMKTDHVTLSASGVAFHLFLALAPGLAAAVSIYGLVADPANVTSLADRLGSSVPEALSTLIEDQLGAVVSSDSGALGVGAAIGILLAVWSASSGMTNMIEAINIAYDEDPDDRPFWKKRGIALGFTVLFIVFVALIGTLLGLAAAMSGALAIVLGVGAAVLSGVLFAVLLSVFYRYGPDRDDPEWSWASVGAVIAVVLWLIASAAFSFYVANFGSYNETYGALGAIVVVLLWLFISALVVMVGAEINAEMEHQTTSDTTKGPEQPIGDRDATVADTVGDTAS
ncbi:YihY/virulence factor BrkB family protein [Ilumatobacter sp.]|uniref:YihY/virulence factor BrkB family protein n=1 Tax=Ilumatobacter sp. TaxID=1967498 RepID=UPI003B515ABF